VEEHLKRASPRKKKTLEGSSFDLAAGFGRAAASGGTVACPLGSARPW